MYLQIFHVEFKDNFEKKALKVLGIFPSNYHFFKYYFVFTYNKCTKVTNRYIARFFKKNFRI